MFSQADISKTVGETPEICVLGIPNHSIFTKRQVVGSSDGLFLFGTAGLGSKTMTSCMEMVHLYELLPRKVQEIHCKRIHRHLDHPGK
jgi:hypothetical protein